MLAGPPQRSGQLASWPEHHPPGRSRISFAMARIESGDNILLVERSTELASKLEVEEFWAAAKPMIKEVNRRVRDSILKC